MDGITCFQNMATTHIPLDFQMLGSGRVSWELNYVLGMSSQGTDSFDADLRLLQVYYSKLCQVDPSIQLQFTQEKCLQEYFATFALFIVHSLTFMATVFLPKDVLDMCKPKPDGTENEKGDTLVFGLLKLWERSFQKLVSYDDHAYIQNYLVE